MISYEKAKLIVTEFVDIFLHMDLMEGLGGTKL